MVVTTMRNNNADGVKRNNKSSSRGRRPGVAGRLPYYFLVSWFLLNAISEAFVPVLVTAPSIVTSSSTTTVTQNQNQNQQRRQRSARRSSSTSTSTSLYFFFKKNDEGRSNGDFPLARYVDVSANYTLAPTPEDYIDLHDGQRLVCVGDVHGDLRALQQFLETAQVYDTTTDSWCGGDTILVQCGDVLDRGVEELACYQLLSKLSQQAVKQKGKVILLVGNHEAMNAMGLFQYAYSDIEHERTIGVAVDATIGGAQNKWRTQYVGNQPARWASYEPGGLLAHSLMRNMKVAIRVGRTVCVHAGLKPSHLKDHGGIEGMNAAFREWISLGDDICEGDHCDAQEGIIHKNNPVIYNHHGQYPADTPRQPWIEAETRQTYYINSIPKFLAAGAGASGPIWMRDYSSPHDVPPTDPDGKIQDQLDETLTLLDADRMVMGHSIQQRINCALDGKAWRIDIGASRGCINGTPEVLEVVCRMGSSGDDGDGGVAETDEVSVLTKAPTSHPGGRVPEKERQVDCYTAAAAEANFM